MEEGLHERSCLSWTSIHCLLRNPRIRYSPVSAELALSISYLYLLCSLFNVVKRFSPSTMSSISSQSGSNASVHVDIDEQNPSRLYHIYRKPLHRHYEIKSPGDQCLYYGEISSFTANKPDLILHSGASPEDPVVAASKFQNFSRDSTLGLGDPENVNQVQWERMSKISTIPPRYRLEMTLPSQQGDEERRSFLWKRTNHVKVDGSTSGWNPRNYKLVDERTGDLLAVFTREMSISKSGTLQVKAELGDSFDTMAIISCLSLYEQSRRRNRG